MWSWSILWNLLMMKASGNILIFTWLCSLQVIHWPPEQYTLQTLGWVRTWLLIWPTASVYTFLFSWLSQIMNPYYWGRCWVTRTICLQKYTHRPAAAQVLNCQHVILHAYWLTALALSQLILSDLKLCHFTVIDYFSTEFITPNSLFLNSCANPSQTEKVTVIV